MSGIVVVGAGECGTRAAFALREAGYAGPVTLIGEERHLPYERPPLSKAWPVAPKPIVDAPAFSERDIRLVTGTKVVAIEAAERRVRLADGGELAYNRLLLATGARPRVLPGLEAALTLRTLEDAEAILGSLSKGRRLVVIGGGFIGLELAAVARGQGAEVTVLEVADRLMARAVPADIAARVEARHEAEGVMIRFGAVLGRVAADRVDLADGTSIAADVVVAGVGAVPNTELAAAAGLAVDNGVVVDRHLRSSDTDIFAAGDCCAFPYRGRRVRLESWRCAQDQGNHAAQAMVGSGEPYERVPWFWSDQYDLGLQVAGLAEPGLPFVRRDREDGSVLLFQLGEDGTLASASGLGTGTAVARDIRLAEMMIARGSQPDPAALVDPKVGLKSLL